MSFRIIILAAGEGKRMHSSLPKVLVTLQGKPMLCRLLDAVVAAAIDPRPIVVIAGAQRGELVREATAGYTMEYVVQEQQLGTAHAVQMCQQAAQGAEHVMILSGDHPLMSAATLRRFSQEHLAQHASLSMMTTTVPDFDHWRQAFSQFGRILRDEHGHISGIVDSKDATALQLEIREVNPAYFCFRSDWLWGQINRVGRENAQGEYYLTDLVAIAHASSVPVSTIPVEPFEALGINSAEHLKEVERLLAARNLQS